MANSNNNTDKRLRESLERRGLATQSTAKKQGVSNKTVRALNKIRRIESEFGLHNW